MTGSRYGQRQGLRCAHGRPEPVRHLRPALRADLELLAGRQGQLRGRPGGRRRVPRGLPRQRDKARAVPPLPGPRRALPGRRGRASGSSSTSAPACRPPTTPTRWPSGSPRSRGSSTSTTTRWCWRTPGPAHQLARGRHHLHRRRPARPASILAEAAEDAGLRPAGRAAAASACSATSPTTTRPAASSRALLDGLPSGSYLVQCDGTDTNPDYVAALERYRDSGGVPYNARAHEQIVGYFDGLELVEPGVVPIHPGGPKPARSAGPRRLRVRWRRPQALIPWPTRRCSTRCGASSPSGLRPPTG